MRKIYYIIIFIILVLPSFVKASGMTLIKVGNKYYDDLQEAINNASSNDTISLITDVKTDETININKTVNINLNGNTIEAKEKVFLIEGGSLHLTGKGKVKETKPYNGTIVIKGSQNSNDLNYSTLKVDKEVTLEGWSGISVQHNNQKSYGVLINFQGKINAINDITGDTGIGIYVNGSITEETNSPIININSESKIDSTGVGLYLAGYSTFNIDNANISGKESAISIKAGTLNIKSGTFYCDGLDNTPTQGNNNGVNPSGATIQIESNDGYAGNIEINIQGGNLTSKNSHVIYEYIGRGNTSLVKEIILSGGTYKSHSNKNVFSLSNSLLNRHNKFIKGGKYASNPDEYLVDGYITSLLDNLYVVMKSTMKEEIVNSTNNVTIKIIIYLLSITIILTAVYFNKTKILKFIKFNKQN